MGKIVGKVTKVTTKSYNIDGLGAMVENSITITAPDGYSVTVKKHTKKSTNFTLAEGTEVSAEYEEKERTTKEGETFIVRKVIERGLVLLNQPKTNTEEREAGVGVELAENRSKKTSTATVDWAAKDLSMEVSGLLQAIIAHHGFDKNTGTILRDALSLKRLVAAELKEGVSKVNKETEARVTKAVTKAKKVEVTDDEECPFDLDNES